MNDGAMNFPPASMICPSCLAPLVIESKELRCDRCGETYPRAEDGQADFRLKKERRVTASYKLGVYPEVPNGVLQQNLRPRRESQGKDLAKADFHGDLTYGNRLTSEFLSYFPQASGADDWMLDLGCGERNFETVCRELTGFRYVGVDFVGTKPNLLVDAHALPFKAETFRFVLSVAVLEHLAYPDIAMDEVFRVLTPGGVFAGTVAFLEPFHMESHFHMTHLGLYRLLVRAGFEVVAIAPNAEWSGARAQAEMSLFPGLPRMVRRSLQSPTTLLSRMLWAVKQANDAGRAEEKRDRVLETTGGFRFIARRP